MRIIITFGKDFSLKLRRVVSNEPLAIDIKAEPLPNTAPTKTTEPAQEFPLAKFLEQLRDTPT